MASTTLTRSLGSAGNQRLMTFSFWLKRGSLSPTAYGLFNRYISSGNYFAILLNDGDALEVRNYSGGSSELRRSTPAVFRDTSAWYHFVVTIDTAQAVTDDRVKIYVNGVQQTLTGTNPALNLDVDWNSAGDNVIGTGVTSSYFDGSMAHIHFIEGTAYNASAFGETDATTGIWKPKTTPSVTYGTNGFFLKFENSGAFGTDSSGNGNTFTVNGTMTQTIDTPSNVFATFNALNEQSSISYSNGNTTFTNSSSANRMAFSNLGVTKGKYYAEIKVGAISNYMRIGIADISKYIPVTNAYLTNISNSANYSNDGVIFIGSSSQGTFSTFTTNDIVNIALDMDNGYVYFGKNGTWQNSGDPTSGGSGTGGFAISNYLTETYCFGLSSFDGGTDNVANANFGNGYFGTTAVSSAENPDDGIGIFEYAVPTGYKALCTKSINAQEYD